MQCPSETLTQIRCDQILDVAEDLIESQGIVSFNFSQIAKDVGCSTGTLYKFFERKEDVLVCLFLRSATSNYMPIFVNENPELTPQERLLLPILFTFETIKRSKSFFTLRSVSVNAMIWKLASDSKVKMFKQRINSFWQWLTDAVNLAIKNGDLQATPLQAKELVQGIIFYLTGSITQFESGLISSEFLSDQSSTYYRHLSRLMAQYNWRTPVTQELFASLESRTISFFQKNYKKHLTCRACKDLSDSLNATSRAYSGCSNC